MVYTIILSKQSMLFSNHNNHNKHTHTHAHTHINTNNTTKTTQHTTQTHNTHTQPHNTPTSKHPTAHTHTCLLEVTLDRGRETSIVVFAGCVRKFKSC